MLGLGGQANALDDTPAKFEPVVPDDLDLSDLTEPTLPEVPTLDVPIRHSLTAPTARSSTGRS